ncbi:MAG: YraN family protein [Sedimenticolaceae bacterium]|jgi:putative endonuclease
MAKTQDLGKDAETRAETLLRRSGLRPIARNYRCRAGEIDLIMRDGEHLVFVEVRLRSHPGYGGALSSVGTHKQQRLILAARHYLMSSGWQGPCRFDVVGFDRGGDATWISDAFSA